MKNTKTSYVYVYLDSRKPGDFIYKSFKFQFEPFYVGQGAGNRVYDHLNHDKRNKKKYNKIKKIIKETEYNPLIIIIKNNLTKEQAIKLEKKLIKVIGRLDIKTGPLTNLTDGGEGAENLSKEIRLKISNSLKGIKHPNYGKRGPEMPMYGKKHSKETRLKISEKNKGKKNYMYGRKHSSETKAKITEKLKINSFFKGKKGAAHPNYGKKLSVETKNRMSASKTGENHPAFGKKFNNEHKRKLSESKKKKYELTNPFGEKFIIHGITTDSIIKKNNLCPSSLVKVAKGKLNHYKGWKCCLLNSENEKK